MNLRELANRANNFDVNKEIISSIKEHQAEIVDANVEQLMKGFDSEGKRLEKYSSPEYARMKNQMNPAPGIGNPDLRLEGQFHEAFFVAEINKDFFKISSKDWKREKLIRWYGIDIFGLNESNKIEIGNSIIWMSLAKFKQVLFS